MSDHNSNSQSNPESWDEPHVDGEHYIEGYVGHLLSDIANEGAMASDDAPYDMDVMYSEFEYMVAANGNCTP